MIVGLGDVEVLGVDDAPGAPLGVHIRSGAPLGVHIRSGAPRPACGGCGGSVWSKGAAVVKLVDLPAFGRPVRLVWHRRPVPSHEFLLRSRLGLMQGDADVQTVPEEP